jgi:hypothetical protein
MYYNRKFLGCQPVRADYFCKAAFFQEIKRMGLPDDKVAIGILNCSGGRLPPLQF